MYPDMDLSLLFMAAFFSAVLLFLTDEKGHANSIQSTMPGEGGERKIKNQKCNIRWCTLGTIKCNSQIARWAFLMPMASWINCLRENLGELL